MVVDWTDRVGDYPRCRLAVDLGEIMQADKSDLKTLASGLIPAGFDAARLPADGRDEVRAAIDVILKLSDHSNAKLSLALEQLDRAAAEIERIKSANVKIGAWLSAALDDPQVCDEMKNDIREWFA